MSEIQNTKLFCKRGCGAKTGSQSCISTDEYHVWEIDKRNLQGRRAYDLDMYTFGKGIDGLWNNLGRRKTDFWE